jgi:hypothetical protein
MMALLHEKSPALLPVMGFMANAKRSNQGLAAEGNGHAA